MFSSRFSIGLVFSKRLRHRSIGLMPLFINRWDKCCHSSTMANFSCHNYCWKNATKVDCLLEDTTID